MSDPAMKLLGLIGLAMIGYASTAAALDSIRARSRRRRARKRSGLPAPRVFDVGEHPALGASMLLPAPLEERFLTADGTQETRQEHFERLAKALHLVVAVGQRQRSCLRCLSGGVTPTMVEYRKMDDHIVAVMDFTCHNCGAAVRGWTRSTYAACMLAAEAWEGMLTARALFDSEAADQAAPPE